MDGNRRWAKGKGLPTLQGHRAGGEKLKEVAKWAKDVGIQHLIVFAFSTENWSRTPEEVSYMLKLLGEFLQKELEHFNKDGGVLHCVGDLSRFPADLQKTLAEACEKTHSNPGPHIYFALNYGGRQEILSAVKKIVKEMQAKPSDRKAVQDGRPTSQEAEFGENITEEYFAKHLQTYPMPDPDLIIRTSGEMRLSGFLPWQSVYSELFFTKTFWPDFSKEEFLKILDEYGERERRLGK